MNLNMQNGNSILNFRYREHILISFIIHDLKQITYALEISRCVLVLASVGFFVSFVSFRYILKQKRVLNVFRRFENQFRIRM